MLIIKLIQKFLWVPLVSTVFHIKNHKIQNNTGKNKAIVSLITWDHEKKISLSISTKLVNWYNIQIIKKKGRISKNFDHSSDLNLPRRFIIIDVLFSELFSVMLGKN